MKLETVAKGKDEIKLTLDYAQLLAIVAASVYDTDYKSGQVKEAIEIAEQLIAAAALRTK